MFTKTKVYNVNSVKCHSLLQRFFSSINTKTIMMKFLFSNVIIVVAVSKEKIGFKFTSKNHAK